jgi:RNA polymerase sigma-70 factor (ECF subfamily)
MARETPTEKLVMRSGMDTTSGSLLVRLRQPSPQADWARFVELYTPFLLEGARRAGLQAQDAADLVQDVFMAVLQELPRFNYDKSKSFRGWLRTVARRKWANRQRGRGKLTEVQEAALADVAGPEDLEAFWDAEHHKRLTTRALELMQAEFEPTTWKACWEFVAQSRPAADVGAELGLSENAVYIAKWRVMRRLREELQGLLD